MKLIVSKFFNFKVQLIHTLHFVFERYVGWLVLESGGDKEDRWTEYRCYNNLGSQNFLII